MKLVFVVLDKKQVRFGIVYLYSYLKMYGNSVDMYLVEFVNDGQFINDIKRINPDFILYSAMTGEFNQLYGINKMLKSNGIEFYSLWGGPHPTFGPEMIEKEGIDGICQGEGEEALLEFCQKMPFKTSDFNIKNWIFKLDGKIIKNPLRDLIDLNILPVPDYSIFDIKDNVKLSATVCRGCYFNCTYCFNRQWKDMYNNHKDPLRVYPVDKIIDGIKNVKIKTPSLNFIVFHDSIFPINKKEWVAEFCAEYRKQIGIPFQINLHPAMVSREGIKQLKDAGAVKVNFAIESGSEWIRRKILARYTSDEVILNAARIVKENGLLLTIQNMTCLPHETWQDAKQTLELNIRCKPDAAVISKFAPYPKTELTEMAIRDGFLSRGEFEDHIPDNYHWISLLNFKNSKDKQKMEFLVNFFTLAAVFPFLKPLIYLAVRTKKNPLIEKVYAYIDTHTWRTIVHQDNVEKFRYSRSIFYKPKLFLKLIYHIAVNKKYI
jgi:radical SAM superfamily enzyme YgiQ (UPF0313 family)